MDNRQRRGYDSFVGSNLDEAAETQAGEETEEPWDERLELPPKRPPVPNLPPEMLPEPLRAWLVDVSERTCLPLELTAAPAVVSLGAVVGRKVGIYPRKYDNWKAVPNLWGAVVGRPGLMKTTAVDEGTKPLKRLAFEASQAYQDALLEAEVASDTLKIELEAIKKEIA